MGDERNRRPARRLGQRGRCRRGPGQSRVIFFDSSFWIAMRLPQDAHHDVALDLLERHGDGELLTSNHVRGETWTFLRRRAGHGEAVTFLDMLERSPRTKVDRIDGVLEEEALRWLRRHDERTYSFVDATSFAL